MAFKRINERLIHYWAAGDGFEKGRPYVLFIHGAGGGQHIWIYQKGFFKKEFNPVLLDLPGHGASEGDGESEIGKYAEHVYGFIKDLGLPKVFLVGHSMGGAIVQTMALKYPEAIKGIILVGTGARLRVLPMILNGIREDFEKTVRLINEMHFSRKVSQDLLAKSLESMLKVRPEILYGDYLACDRFDMMKEVEKIDLPTLILCGDEDQLTPVKYSQFLRDRIRGSRLEVLFGAGHMVMMESPEAFNEKIREFIFNPTFSESK